MKPRKLPAAAILACCAALASGQSLKWANYAPMSAPSDDFAQQMVRGSDGGYFVCAYASGDAPSGGAGNELLTHYDSTGNPLWVRAVPYQVTEIGAAPDGIVMLEQTPNKLYVRKLDNSGNFMWQTACAVQSNSDNMFMHLDGSGNVSLVANYVQQPETIFQNNARTNIAIFHINTGGVVAWSKMLAVQGTSQNARAITVDSSGALWIVGAREFDPGQEAFISRFGPGGSQLCTATFSSSAGTSGTSMDTAQAIATDSNNHAFVGIQASPLNSTSYSIVREYGPGGGLWHQVSFPQFIYFENLAADSDGQVTGLGANQRLFLFKISTARTLRWLTVVPNSKDSDPSQDSRMDRLAVDGSGNSFLTYTVWSSPSPDMATTKFNDSGAPVWTNRENGSVNAEDDGLGVLFVPSGQVVALGKINTGTATYNDTMMVSLNPSGSVNWRSQHDAAAQSPITSGDDLGGSRLIKGHVLQSAATMPDGTTYYPSAIYPGFPGVYQVRRSWLTKVNPDGTTAWIKSFDPTYPFNQYGGSEVKAMADGSVILLTQSGSTPTQNAFVLEKRISSAGAVEWSASIPGNLYKHDFDPAGDLLMATGNSPAAPTITKVTSNGQIAWTVASSVEDIRWDPSTGGFYALQAGAVSNTQYPINLVKFTPGGTVAWHVPLGVTWNALNHPGLASVGLTVAQNGDVALSYTYVTSSATYDSYTSNLATFDGTGSLLWDQQLDSYQDSSVTFTHEYGNAAYQQADTQLDAAGNIYVLGEAISDFGNSPPRGLLTKLSPAGSVLWSKAVPVGLGRIAQSNGSVYLCGATNQPTGARDVSVMKLGPDGSLGWPTAGGGTGVFSYDPGWKADDWNPNLGRFGAGADSSGGIYITGCMPKPSGLWSVGTLKIGD